MRITHLTTDDVNRAQVRSWAAEHGVRAVSPTGRRRPAAGLVADLDYLPFDRRAWVSAVLAAGVDRPVLAHGYGVTDAEADALRRRGVRVVRGRLGPADVARWLRRIARPVTSS